MFEFEKQAEELAGEITRGPCMNLYRIEPEWWNEPGGVVARFSLRHADDRTRTWEICRARNLHARVEAAFADLLETFGSRPRWKLKGVGRSGDFVVEIPGASSAEELRLRMAVEEAG